MTVYKPSVDHWTKISNSRPLNFYPLSHFPFYFIVNEGKIKAIKKFQPQNRGFLLEFQDGDRKYVLQANTEDKVSVKVNNTTLNYLWLYYY